MTWREELLERLTAGVPCGYERGGPPATEPTCFAAIALSIYGRREPSLQAARWLASIQNDDGSVGPSAALCTPGWPTALAILASVYSDHSGSNDSFGLFDTSDSSNHDDTRLASPFNDSRALAWLLDCQGYTIAPGPLLGHDSSLIAWPWEVGTHSWVEPTALAVIALKSVGLRDHMRTRQGVRMLYDRLLPDGGCNYGNTTVLGQILRPHVQPTGLALLALHGEENHDERIARSLEYLQNDITRESATASLCYALLALRRYERDVAAADEWLAHSAKRTLSRGASPYRLALLLLAGRAVRGG